VSGRFTAPTSSGKYTPPIPKTERHSPRWFGPLVIAFLLLGLVTIVLNYFSQLPGSPSTWYLIGGLGTIFVGFAMATRYH
jgi:hypothetical protein